MAGMIGLGFLVWANSNTVAAQPLQQVVSESWQLFESGQWTEAIEKSTECIKKWGTQAEILQDDLRDQPLPPTGSVDDDVKRQIFANGVLNEVGACYFILSESLLKLNQCSEAESALTKLKIFTHARIYDASGEGFFWDPTLPARAHLKEIRTSASCRG